MPATSCNYASNSYINTKTRLVRHMALTLCGKLPREMVSSIRRFTKLLYRSIVTNSFASFILLTMFLLNLWMHPSNKRTLLREEVRCYREKDHISYRHLHKFQVKQLSFDTSSYLLTRLLHNTISHPQVSLIAEKLPRHFVALPLAPLPIMYDLST